jgi:hypothetical protein
MRGQEDELLSKDSTPTKDVVSTVNITEIPDCSLIDQQYFKSGDKRLTLK